METVEFVKDKFGKLKKNDKISKLIVSIVGAVLLFLLMIIGKVFLSGLYLGQILSQYSVFDIISSNILEFDYRIEILIGIIILLISIVEIFIVRFYLKRTWRLFFPAVLICIFFIIIGIAQALGMNNYWMIFENMIALQIAVLIVAEYFKLIATTNNVLNPVKAIYYTMLFIAFIIMQFKLDQSKELSYIAFFALTFLFFLFVKFFEYIDNTKDSKTLILVRNSPLILIFIWFLVSIINHNEILRNVIIINMVIIMFLIIDWCQGKLRKKAIKPVYFP